MFDTRSLAGAALVCLAASGCYSYLPLDTSVRPPATGEMIALGITDRGRVGLADRLGAGVTRIEGRLKASSVSDFDVSVFKIAHIGVGESRWSGETVKVSRDFIGTVEGREFSRGRTTVAASVVGGAIVAFIVTRTLISAGNEAGEPGPDPDPPGTIRWLQLLRFFR